MNSITDTYLTFRVNNVIEYIKLLAEEERITSKIPRQLNKLIYKYYDLFILTNKEVDYEKIKIRTGLNDTNERLILFYLLIEFDLTSRLELSDKKLYDLYNFIVNSIIVFIDLEKNISKNTEQYSYENSIKRTLKKYVDYLDIEYLLLLDKLYPKLEKKYNNSVKENNKFITEYNFENFILTNTKIKNSDNLYLNKFKYKNEKLTSESKKDIEIIDNEFAVELKYINIEIISLKILYEAFTENNKIIFIPLEDLFVSKKSNILKLESLLHLSILKERICFIVNNELIKKYEGNIEYLINNNFNVALSTDKTLTKNQIYKKIKYLFIEDNDDLKDNVESAQKFNLEIIIKGNIKNNKDLDNLMYVN